MIDQQESSKKELPVWPGLSLDELREFANDFCRSRARFDEFGGNQLNSAWDSSVRRVGQLIYKAREFYLSKQMNKKILEPSFKISRPDNVDLSLYLQKIKNEPIISNNDYFGDWLSEPIPQPPEITRINDVKAYFNAARHCLKLILMGTDNTWKKDNLCDEKERTELFKDIEDYFFEPMTMSGSLYFNPLRRFSRGPFDEKETLKGVKWLEKRLKWKQSKEGKMIVVSGNEATIFSDSEGKLNEFSKVAVNWATHKFKSIFIFPDVEPPTDAETSINSILEKIKESYSELKEYFIPFPLDPTFKKDIHWAGEFLHRTAQYYYFEYHDDKLLYIKLTIPLKKPEIWGKNEDWLPYLFIAEEPLVEKFRLWQEAMLSSLFSKSEEPKPVLKKHEKKKGK